MKISEINSLAALGIHPVGGTVRQIKYLLRDNSGGRCEMGLLWDCEKAGLLISDVRLDFIEFIAQKYAAGVPHLNNRCNYTFADFAHDAAEFEAQRGEGIK